MVLGFVGLKMITADYLPLPRVISLGIIVLILRATIGLSMLKAKDGTTAGARK
jgi:predicted tellurium resistance membrane protein TerC